MTNFNKKHQIMESLDSLDQVQADKVLDYIKSLLFNSNEEAHKNLKREALKEIRQALSKKRKVKVAF